MISLIVDRQSIYQLIVAALQKKDILNDGPQFGSVFIFLPEIRLAAAKPDSVQAFFPALLQVDNKTDFFFLSVMVPKEVSVFLG